MMRILPSTESVETHDFKGVSHDADGHQLFTVIATVHHERICESLDDWTLCLAKSFDGITSGGVRKVDGCSDLDVVAEDLCQQHGSLSCVQPSLPGPDLDAVRLLE